MGKASAPLLERRIVAAARADRRPPRAIAREFDALLEDAELRCAGSCAKRPERLFGWGYRPRHRVALFDTTYYLSPVRQNADLRFFVGYVAQPAPPGKPERVHARLFYKDVSLIWRAASHFVRSDRENWIGKGDIRTVRIDGEEVEVSDESTTDLPIEIQDAFENLSRKATRVPRDDRAIERVLRRAPDDRLEAYRDFVEPRRRAQANPRNRIHGGRPIARFRRALEPESLVFAKGYAPDFRRGLLERSTSKSSLYGGRLRRYRILSQNREIQYLFMAGPKQAWIIPPQATTTDLSSYGVRTIDVAADDELSVPGWEYWGGAEVGLSNVDQIPEGFAGETHPRDPSRADASPWLERLPVIRDFRRIVLGQTR
ncbi:MAG: hypothetical protein AAF430_24555 [Myxococcota bacterium]